MLFLSPLALLAGSAVAQEKPRQAFDCDVPANHYSSVSQDLVEPFGISGSVKVVEMRSGDYLPVAGVLLRSAEGLNGVGFQLAAPSKDAELFDVILNTRNNGVSNQRIIAQISTRDTIPFSLLIDNSGKIRLAIGGTNYDIADFPPSELNGMVFCSTGQFKFTELTFSGR
ncbi:hypothetical protein B2G71_17370 [Novosphingobium sp. PC22D]|uniref:hypothetical protein n=1 Tax=Novosphingobium sp. PC22D TaxID=1962403 RepID=UPI000BF1B1B4|nr:hypothetical protein [Novosphingobium sp. PC22D]PEQ11333.1 hypothetical protein B2G71_17370 [Novosphingobium sp. PC22D]